MTQLRPEQRYAQSVKPELDRAVNLIDGIKLKPGRRDESGATVDPRVFSGAVPLMFRELSVDDDIWVGGDVFDLWPIRSKGMTFDCDDVDAVIHSLTSVTPKQARGRVRLLRPRMLRHSWARITGDQGETYERYYSVASDGWLDDITNIDQTKYRMISAHPVPADHQLCVRALAGGAMWLEYQWTVRVSAVGSNFAITIPTTPEGGRKLLSLRDVPSGRERRAALRHWVSAHTREIAAKDGDVREVDVVEHLRGAQPFHWDDLHGEIRPSAYDLRAAEAARSRANRRDVAS